MPYSMILACIVNTDISSINMLASHLNADALLHLVKIVHQASASMSFDQYIATNMEAKIIALETLVTL